MAPYSQCLTTALSLSRLDFTNVLISAINKSVMGVHIFDLDCPQVSLSGFGTGWMATTTYAGFTEGGTVKCHINVSSSDYSGVIGVGLILYPGEIQLTRTIEEPESPDMCVTSASTLTNCHVNMTVYDLYLNPPNETLYEVLRKMKDFVDIYARDAVCKTLAPLLQSSMVNNSFPFTPERKDEGRTILPLNQSPLIRALMSILSQVTIGGVHFSVAAQPQRLSFLISRPGGTHARYAGDLVPAPPDESSVDWVRGLVDACAEGALPNPITVYGMPGNITDLVAELNSSQTLFATFDVDVSVAASKDNWISIYLDDGVAIENLRMQPKTDGLGTLLTQLAAPKLEKMINEKIASALALLAGSVVLRADDNEKTNRTVKLSLGRYTAVRDSPLLASMIVVSCLGVLACVLLVWRNVRRHRAKPVLSSTTGAPLSVFRIVAEDVFLISGVVVCLLLFVASNTMTGATVVLGGEVNTYSFSLGSTITDLWHAGLYPLCVCVLLFSGVYPYMKLLGILFFTVWAHRPSSRVLKLIDYIGKLSLIDTFALMVMVSGLEIPSIAYVWIHRSFYLFMYATILSIALGNYATLLWRAGTTLRREDSEKKGTRGSVAFSSAEVEPATTSPLEPQVSFPSMNGSSVPRGGPSAPNERESRRRRYWRQAAKVGLCIPSMLMIACSIPAWVVPTFRYSIGGFARLLTPPGQSLTLWKLSSLGGRNDALDLLAVCFFTILIAPCLYVALYPKCAFLASWCAVDVLVIACVVGLLQLQQFVRFVLKDDKDILCTAHASLLWPIYPLAVAAVLVWVYIAREFLQHVFTRKALTAMPPNP
ncbi:paraquat-inducible protein A, putative [Leishmania tarentolae]|uniref:Paraquat-inducible protein A, putative n=1 Tax=Leishmania tarentolae TaxID=5689 RepID=A0A640KJY1_LEITA|nr:paraquat-inducible protein A, putative [Leishmania tarentolae]